MAKHTWYTAIARIVTYTTYVVAMPFDFPLAFGVVVVFIEFTFPRYSP
jgi:hypothetical protein